MTETAKRFLFWTPRIVCLIFAAFLGMFALDVFGEGYNLGETVVALMIHLIPSVFVVAALLVSWRWEWVGGVLFIGLAVLYIFLFRGRFPWQTYLAISGPSFLVGILFLVNWRYRRELREGR